MTCTHRVPVNSANLEGRSETPPSATAFFFLCSVVDVVFCCLLHSAFKLMFSLMSVASRTVCGAEGLHFLDRQCRHRGVPHVLRRPRLLSQQRPARHLCGVHPLVHVRGREHSHDAADCKVSQILLPEPSALGGNLDKMNADMSLLRGSPLCLYRDGHTLSYCNNNRAEGIMFYWSCEIQLWRKGQHFK